MNMIVLAIELDQFSLKIITDAGEDAMEIGEDLFGENFAPGFCHEDQVNMHHKDTVSAVADIVAFLHRPRLYSIRCNGSKPSNTNSCPTATSSAICAALPDRAGSCSTRPWRCKKPTMKQETSSYATWKWRTSFRHGKANSLGSRNLHHKPCNMRSRTWIVPSPTSSRNGQNTHVSKSVGTGTASAFPRDSSSIRPTAESSCQNSAGFVTGTAGKFLARSAMSPSAAAMANGSSPSKPNAK